jgi:hypothetical protein
LNIKPKPSISYTSLNCSEKLGNYLAFECGSWIMNQVLRVYDANLLRGILQNSKEKKYNKMSEAIHNILSNGANKSRLRLHRHISRNWSQEAMHGPSHSATKPFFVQTSKKCQSCHNKHSDECTYLHHMPDASPSIPWEDRHHHLNEPAAI